MKTHAYPDPTSFDSLVDLLDDAAERYPAERPSLSLRTDEGITLAWSSHEVRRRARHVAWRLRAMGLESGDRLLTWSPSTPALPAVYWGAMMAGVIIVPLDLRMAPAVLRRIADRVEVGLAGHRHRAGRARPRREPARPSITRHHRPAGG